MGLNPMSLMKLAGLRKRLAENHPKVAAFLGSVIGSGLPEGTILEVTVTKPGEAPVTTNMRVSQSDVEIMREISEALR